MFTIYYAAKWERSVNYMHKYTQAVNAKYSITYFKICICLLNVSPKAYFNGDIKKCMHDGFQYLQRNANTNSIKVEYRLTK